MTQDTSSGLVGSLVGVSQHGALGRQRIRASASVHWTRMSADERFWTSTQMAVFERRIGGLMAPTVQERQAIARPINWSLNHTVSGLPRGPFLASPVNQIHPPDLEIGRWHNRTISCDSHNRWTPMKRTTYLAALLQEFSFSSHGVCR